MGPRAGLVIVTMWRNSSCRESKPGCLALSLVTVLSELHCPQQCKLEKKKGYNQTNDKGKKQTKKWEKKGRIHTISKLNTLLKRVHSFLQWLYSMIIINDGILFLLLSTCQENKCKALQCVLVFCCLSQQWWCSLVYYLFPKGKSPRSGRYEPGVDSYWAIRLYPFAPNQPAGKLRQTQSV